MMLAKPENKPAFKLFGDLEAQSNKLMLVRNLLGAGEFSVAYGHPGSAKSVLLQDMGCHVAAGWDWQGRRVLQGAVLFIALERRNLVERRAIAFRNKHGIDNLPFAIAGGVHDFRDARTAALFGDMCRQVEDSTGSAVVLVLIDTISRALCGGDENSPKDVGALVNTLGRLQLITNAHICAAHHMPQDSGDRMRGHGALLGAVDTTVHIEKGTIRTATVVKANDSEEGERISFTLESVIIGTDDDGQATTAPVVVPVDAETARHQGRSAKWPRGLRLVHDAITEAISAHGFDHRLSSDGPTVKAVSLTHAREEHKRRYVSTGDGDRLAAERQSWARSFKDARARGLISGASLPESETIWIVTQ